MVTTGHSFSPRQPQDLVVGVRDQQSVPVPRPRQASRFTIVSTYVIAPSAPQSNSLTVASPLGFNVGNLCQVMLDNGTQFQFTLAAVVGNALSWTGAGLPGGVGILFGDPLENSVTNLSSVGGT